jgi:hypothetical protein
LIGYDASLRGRNLAAQEKRGIEPEYIEPFGINGQRKVNGSGGHDSKHQDMKTGRVGKCPEKAGVSFIDQPDVMFFHIGRYPAEPL